MHYSQASTPTVISNPPGNTAQVFKLRIQVITAPSGTNPPSALLSSNSAFPEDHCLSGKETGMLKDMGGKINNEHEQTVKERFTVASCMSEKKRGKEE